MNIYEKLFDYKNIQLAYERVKNGTINIELYSDDERDKFSECTPYIFKEISEVLKEPNKYEFLPLEILNKPKKKLEEGWVTRPIARMNFYDSVICQCVINIVTEVVRALLPKNNFGYQLTSSDSIAMYENWKVGYSKFINSEIRARDDDSGYEYILEIDIENFYPSIQTKMLKQELFKYIVDDPSCNSSSEIIKLWIDKILMIKCLDVEMGSSIDNSVGLPQGTLYSPLFAMFYIRNIIKIIKKEHNYVHCFGYVDDLRFYCKTEGQANNVKETVLKELQVLELGVNEEKTKIVRINGLIKRKAAIMAKASSLDRAIADDIILNSESIHIMKENLRGLISEAEQIHIGNLEDDKFLERITRFVEYRIGKINLEEGAWNEFLGKLDDDASYLNFSTITHVLCITSKSISSKKRFLNKLCEIIEKEFNRKLSYIQFIGLKYLVLWSPTELRMSEDEVESICRVIKHVSCCETYMKAVFSKIHYDWIDILRTKVSLSMENYKDTELKLMISCKSKNEAVDKKYAFERRSNLKQSGDFLIYRTPFDCVSTRKYLDSETLKNIKYHCMERTSKTQDKKQVEWQCRIPNDQLSLKEQINKLDGNEIFKLLCNLFEWLDVQVNYYNTVVPLSVIDANYIWFNDKISDITIIGNKFIENDCFFYSIPNKLWRRKFVDLISLCFKMEIVTSKHSIVLDSIEFWKFRIVELLRGKNFDMKFFIKSVASILRNPDTMSKVNVEINHYKMAHLFKHYISDVAILDKLLVISMFVEQSWKNGSKECYFYTLHNHEHSRVLINKLHELIEKSGYKIYINQKEAFRLFSACYMHDLGMLAVPTKNKLYDTTNPMITKVITDNDEVLHNLSEIAAEGIDNKVFTLNHIYDTHLKVEQIRECIIRDNHASISSNEIETDYPLLPLSVAERRDIALISNAHSFEKYKVEKIFNIVYDLRHPIRLKLLSHLLRIADLCDAASDRVAAEVIERYAQTMSNISLFHWIKHMSVDRIVINRDIVPELVLNEQNQFVNLRNVTKIDIEIIHNYLPTINIDKNTLKQSCGKKCRNISGNEEYLIKSILDEFKQEQYLDKFQCTGIKDFLYNKNCHLQCSFINEAYRWFFSEIVYLNYYFHKNGIDIVLDLKINHSENFRMDFNYINNKNNKESAQEFMLEYLIG